MSRDEYLSKVFDLLSVNFRADDHTGGMTAAAAGYLLQRLGADHRELGFERFKNVLEALEEQGLLRTGENSKGAYSFWLSEAQLRELPTFRRLKKQVWHAFVANRPPGLRFLNATTGDVEFTLEHVPGPSWKEVTPIDSETQKSWARDFLCEEQIQSPEYEDALREENWYAAFPALLQRQGGNVNVWNKRRSQRVVEHVRAWCATNSVDEAVTLETPTQRKSQKLAVHYEPIGDDLRSVLMAAIGKMSTEELLSIRIPAQHLVEVLRPDLMK